MKQLKTLGFLLITIILAEQISGLEQSVNDIQKQNITLGTGVYAVTTQLEEIKELVSKESVIIDEPDVVSRGSTRAEPVIMRVTAYDLSFESCRKYPDHPEYSITASGNPAKEWYTIAAGPELPFGTRVFIPALKDMPNEGVFTVEDRGSAIKENCLDIFLGESKYDECMEFGVQYLEAYILK